MPEPTSWIDDVDDIAHELKHPLTVAKGFIDLLQNSDPLTERQLHFVQRALEGLDHMEFLVACLLDMAWIESDHLPEAQACDLAERIENCVGLLHSHAERGHVTVHLELDPAPGTIQADERRIDSIFNNLIGNAIKYNREGGEVWVTARGTPESVAVAVRDSGRGISPEDLPRLFTRFFRSSSVKKDKIPGNGLGLSIVRSIIEKYGGHIRVESVLGDGSTFSFTLPRTSRLAEGEEAAREVVSPPVEKAESVDLVVEENTNEVIDAVDDNLQEPKQTIRDEDDPGLAQQV